MRVFEALADAKDMPIGVPDMHFADVPRHVRGREGDVEASGNALFVHGIDIFHPQRHPNAIVGGFDVLNGQCGGVGAFAATTLGSMAQEDFALA